MLLFPCVSVTKAKKISVSPFIRHAYLFVRIACTHCCEAVLIVQILGAAGVIDVC